MRWIVSNSRYELCGLLRIGTDADERLELSTLFGQTRKGSTVPMLARTAA